MFNYFYFRTLYAEHMLLVIHAQTLQFFKEHILLVIHCYISKICILIDQ